MRRIISAVLLAACVAAPAAAQQQGQKPAQQDTTMAAGVLAGKAAAEGRGTRGSFWGGFFGGLVPPAGNIVAYVVQGPAHITAAQQAELSTHNSQYVLGFQAGFNQRSKAMKKSAALTGGVLGTIVTGLLFTAAATYTYSF